jgi:hypothetical protein
MAPYPLLQDVGMTGMQRPHPREWTLCGLPGSFVPLAADGTGKISVLRSLRRRGPGSVEVNLSALGKAEMRERLQDASARSAWA